MSIIDELLDYKFISMTYQIYHPRIKGRRFILLSILVLIAEFYQQQKMKWRPIFIFMYESERNQKEKKEKKGKKEFIVTILNNWLHGKRRIKEKIKGNKKEKRKCSSWKRRKEMNSNVWSWRPQHFNSMVLFKAKAGGEGTSHMLMQPTSNSWK